MTRPQLSVHLAAILAIGVICYLDPFAGIITAATLALIWGMYECLHAKPHRSGKE